MLDAIAGGMLPYVFVLVLLLLAALGLAVLLREVVPTNMVHVVQYHNKKVSYGADKGSGNVYWKWPSWVPRLGVTVIELPVSNFDLPLVGYEAYDKNRVPFVVDVVSFFCIADTDTAARKISSMEELYDQLTKIVQGAVRKILASDEIDSIMLERAKFGDQFTAEVTAQLAEWGVETVKAMELMDIRDSKDSKVIENIMAKQTSFIEMESRKEVARNQQDAQTAEIAAKQTVDIRQQEADQAVGERTAQKDKAVGIADEQARQEILVEERTTAERTMEVRRVEEVKQAEIDKEKEIVAAEEVAQTTVIKADGDLQAEQKKAQGIQAVGEAEAAAKKAMELAPVQAQIELAKEIGQNPAFQDYLKTIEAIKAHIEVGGEQAKALQSADVKVIANSGDAGSGMTSVMDLFSSKGGTNMAAAVEGFAQSPMGEAMLKKFGITAEQAVAAVVTAEASATAEEGADSASTDADADAAPEADEETQG